MNIEELNAEIAKDYNKVKRIAWLKMEISSLEDLLESKNQELDELTKNNQSNVQKLLQDHIKSVNEQLAKGE